MKQCTARVLGIIRRDVAGPDGETVREESQCQQMALTGDKCYYHTWAPASLDRRVEEMNSLAGSGQRRYARWSGGLWLGRK